jgi:hypothetical protein
MNAPLILPVTADHLDPRLSPTVTPQRLNVRPTSAVTLRSGTLASQGPLLPFVVHVCNTQASLQRTTVRLAAEAKAPGSYSEGREIRSYIGGRVS